EVREFHIEQSTLETIHVKIPAHFLVVVLSFHSVNAEELRFFRELVGIGHEHPTVTIATEILSWVEAIAAKLADGSRKFPFITSTEGLSCVFDDSQAMLICQSLEFLHIGALAVEMHGDDSLRFIRDL